MLLHKNIYLKRLLLAGAVGVFVGDLSGNLAGESEKFVPTRQQSHIPHTELSCRLVHRQLHTGIQFRREKRKPRSVGEQIVARTSCSVRCLPSLLLESKRP